MILFEEDWLKHPGAIIDYKTTNPTFLHLANVYSEIGISNCAFHLSLLDPTLSGVDPFSEDLTIEQKRRIIRECKRNFWYYCREIERVDSQGSFENVPYRANRSNIALLWLYFNHITTIYTVIRQTGKTTTMMSLAKWLLNFGTVGSQIGLLTKDDGLRQDTMRDLKQLYSTYPSYMNFSSKADTFNSDLVTCNELGNKLVAKVSNQSPKEADKVGRGVRTATLFVDEGAFVNNIEVALSAFSNSGNAARTNARAKGLPWGTLLFTTAGELSSRDGAYVYKLISNSTQFNEIFFDCKDYEELREIIKKNSSAMDSRDAAIRVSLSMTYRQMGLTDEWMQQKMEETTQSEANMERDLFNIWQTGTSLSPIPQHLLDQINDSEDTEPRTQIYDPYAFILRWYVSKRVVQDAVDSNRPYVIGVDTSDGIGRDDISFYIRDVLTGEVICGATFNELSLITLSEFFADFLEKFPNTTMVIERRSSAPAIIDNIIHKLCAKGINPFKRLYNTIVQHKEKYEKEYNLISRANSHNQDLFLKYKAHIGFKTSGGDNETSRKQLYSTVMLTMFKYTSRETRDRTLIRQALGIIVKNGRVDHVDGGKDDALIGNLLIFWLLLFGRNLTFYGIDPTLILKENKVFLGERYEVEKDEYAKFETMEIERELDNLFSELKTEDDPVIISRIEARIRFLHQDIRGTANHVSVDEMLDNIKKEKRLKRRLR